MSNLTRGCGSCEGQAKSDLSQMSHGPLGFAEPSGSLPGSCCVPSSVPTLPAPVVTGELTLRDTPQSPQAHTEDTHTLCSPRPFLFLLRHVFKMFKRITNS